jgi:16S rRNA (cytidine1402-2'-O)-methyltransferase
MKFKSGLYIVSTPIGNLHDISIRALEVLKASDIIFCEDTRTTQKLLQKHEITNKKLMVYNDHSSPESRKNILDLVNSGKVLSLVSDAGTPLISDPGYKLIRYLQDMGANIDVIPGASAITSALVISGMPTDKFLFLGFLPKTKEGRINTLKKYGNIDATIIFYETALRAKDTLSIIFQVFGNREVSITREITKIFQQSIRKPVKELIDNTEIIYKGEFVILINPEVIQEKITETDIKNRIISMLNETISKKDIAEILCKEFGKKIKKNEIYKICENITQNRDL